MNHLVWIFANLGRECEFVQVLLDLKCTIGIIVMNSRMRLLQALLEQRSA